MSHAKTHLERAHAYERFALYMRQEAERSRETAKREDELAATFDKYAAEERAEAEAEARDHEPSAVVTQPVGNCDGSKLYAYDRSKEDGRGEPLPERCPGCRACS